MVKMNPARLIRENQGKTRRAVALGTGITERTIIRLEAGEGCNGRSLLVLADYYGVSIDEILGREAPEAAPGGDPK
jgi:transcriptional regulator with XRE-family HTH domain